MEWPLWTRAWAQPGWDGTIRQREERQLDSTASASASAPGAWSHGKENEEKDTKKLALDDTCTKQHIQDPPLLVTSREAVRHENANQSGQVDKAGIHGISSQGQVHKKIESSANIPIREDDQEKGGHDLKKSACLTDEDFDSSLEKFLDLSSVDDQTLCTATITDFTNFDIYSTDGEVDDTLKCSDQPTPGQPDVAVLRGDDIPSSSLTEHEDTATTWLLSQIDPNPTSSVVNAESSGGNVFRASLDGPQPTLAWGSFSPHTVSTSAGLVGSVSANNDRSQGRPCFPRTERNTRRHGDSVEAFQRSQQSLFSPELHTTEQYSRIDQYHPQLSRHYNEPLQQIQTPHHHENEEQQQYHLQPHSYSVGNMPHSPHLATSDLTMPYQGFQGSDRVNLDVQNNNDRGGGSLPQQDPEQQHRQHQVEQLAHNQQSSNSSSSALSSPKLNLQQRLRDECLDLAAQSEVLGEAQHHLWHHMEILRSFSRSILLRDADSLTTALATNLAALRGTDGIGRGGQSPMKKDMMTEQQKKNTRAAIVQWAKEMHRCKVRVARLAHRCTMTRCELGGYYLLGWW